MKLSLFGAGTIKRNLNILLVTAYNSFSLAPAYFYEVAKKKRLDHINLAFYLRYYPRFFHEVDYSFIRDILVIKPDILAFSCFFWNYENNLKLANLAQSLNDKIYVLLGGPHVGDFDCAKKILEENSCIDGALCGEADYSFHELVVSIAKETDQRKTPGLVYRNENKILTGVESYQVDDLIDLPPIYDINSEYVASKFNGYHALPLETIRGCRSKCSFCHYCVNTLRFMPLKKSESEIAFLCKNKAKYVRVCDSHFGGSRARAIELLEIIKHYNKHETAFYIYPDPNHVDDDYIKAARKANCHIISLGIETLDDAVIQNISRKVSSKKSLKALSIMQKANIDPQVDLIFGLPKQNLKSFINDIVNLKAMGYNDILFSPLMLLPGTELTKSFGDWGYKILDTPQKYAISQFLSDGEYIQALRAIDLHKILNIIPCTESYVFNKYHGGENYRNFMKSMFSININTTCPEIDKITESFVIGANFLINRHSNIGNLLKKLFRQVLNVEFNSDLYIDEIIKYDVYNQAMKKRCQEIQEDIYGRGLSHYAYSWDHMELSKLLLREHCWLKTFSCPPDLLNYKSSDNGIMKDKTYCIFICEQNKSYFISGQEYEFLSYFQNTDQKPCLNCSDQFIKFNILKWLEKGALKTG